VFRLLVPATKHLAFAFAALLAFAGSQASAADPATSPLLIGGMPVDPTCLISLANGDSSRLDPIDLHRCHRTDLVVTRGPSDPRMIGFEYHFRTDQAQPRSPYFFYRYLGDWHHHALLFIESGGGGTGAFTQLVGVDRTANMLRAVETVAGGDRCNGGIFHAFVVGGRLSYEERITPFDLVSLAGTASKLVAYKDLEASASSCVADVHHTDSQWVAVTLANPALEDQKGWTGQYRYQPCFNRIYRGFVSRGETELDRRGVARFAAAFENSCMRSR
jgi:hypothetical protein